MTQETEKPASGELEVALRQWDNWRSYISKGGGASWPRDAFEAMVDGFLERLAEAQVRAEVAEARLSAVEQENARLRKALEPFANVANGYSDKLDPNDRPVGPFQLGFCRRARAALSPATNPLDATSPAARCMMSDSLRLCPFCGGEAEMVSVSPYRHYVRCMECSEQFEHGLPEHAAEAWNRRAPDPALTEAQARAEAAEARLSAVEQENARLRTDAAFLLDRLDDYDACSENGWREFNGHVAPAIARLRAALSPENPDDQR